MAEREPQFNPPEPEIKPKTRAEKLEELMDREEERRARHHLELLDLQLEDLRGKKVVDLDAGPSIIERTARKAGIDSILSLDNRLKNVSQRPELKGRLLADARALPFADESIDLIISHAGPHTEVKERDIDRLLEEIERVLTKDGQAKLYPARLKFIHDELEDKSAAVRRIFSQTHRTAEDNETLARLGMESIEKSTQYLQDKGYDLALQENQTNPPELEQDTKYYWMLKKKMGK